MLQDRHFYKCVAVAEASLKALKNAGLVANAKKTKCMSVTSKCNAGQCQSTQTTNKSFHMVKLKYL